MNYQEINIVWYKISKWVSFGVSVMIKYIIKMIIKCDVIIDIRNLIF